MNEKNIPLHATIEIIPNIRVHCLPDQDQPDIFGPWIPWRLCGFIAIKATWLWTDGSTKEKLCLYGTHLIIFCPQPFPWDVGSCLKEDLSPVQHWWKKMLTSHLKHKQEGWSPLRLYLRPPPPRMNPLCIRADHFNQCEFEFNSSLTSSTPRVTNDASVMFNVLRYKNTQLAEV